MNDPVKVIKAHPLVSVGLAVAFGYWLRCAHVTAMMPMRRSTVTGHFINESAR